MDKLKMQSVDGVALNIDKILELFPNTETEIIQDGKPTRAVDFDVLRQELAYSIVEGPEERYQFTWPDKRETMLKANLPIPATLRPVYNDVELDGKKIRGSVGRDGTIGGFDSENLYIEGDNLEVLKLLQKSYLGKVKMIYIDPPYNTGNDFVYHDDSSRSLEEEDFAAGNIDELGNRYRKNTDANGRFHSEWCSMIYARLMVARSLLSDDGVILISIDDCEQEHIKAICDEIYSCLYEEEFNTTKSISSRGTWPKIDDFIESQTSLEIGNIAINILAEVRKYKSEKNISIKEIIDEIIVYIDTTKKIDFVAEDLKNVCNVNNIKFVEGKNFEVKF